MAVIPQWNPANGSVLSPQGFVGTPYVSPIFFVSLSGEFDIGSIIGFTTTFLIPGLTLTTPAGFPVLVPEQPDTAVIPFNITGTPLAPPNPLDAPINYNFTITLQGVDIDNPNPVNYSFIVNPNPNPPTPPKKKRVIAVPPTICCDPNSFADKVCPPVVQHKGYYYDKISDNCYILRRR